MGRPLGSKNSDDASRLRFECRKVTDKFVRAWIEALEAVNSDGSVDHETRIKAANALADRGYGRPAQAITGADGDAIKVDASSGIYEMLKRLAEDK